MATLSLSKNKTSARLDKIRVLTPAQSQALRREKIKLATQWLESFPVFTGETVLLQIGINKTLARLRVEGALPFSAQHLSRAIFYKTNYYKYKQLGLQGQRYNLQREPVSEPALSDSASRCATS